MRNRFQALSQCCSVTAVLVLMGLISAPTMGQYQNDINRWKAQDALDPPAAGAILFAGSSSIRRFEQMSLDFADYRVLQRGFGGAHFDDLNTYMNDIILPYQPRAIVIWAGTNDIASGQPGTEVFADYQQFVATVHGAQPDVDIFYLGIMPTPGRFDNGPEEAVANSSIQTVAAGNARLHYIDLPSAFFALNPPDDPNFTGKFVDDIHLNRQGYELWTRIIRPQLESVVAPNKVFTLNPNTPAAGGRLLLDFGPSNTEDGDHTVNPDINGHYWNNWHAAIGEQAINAGEHLGNLIDIGGVATGIDLTITAGYLSNGKLNGGLLSPDPNLLGDLAIGTATQDYFFCTADDLVGFGNDDVGGGFMLDGLNPDLAYDFRFFGSRNTTSTRITEYLVTGRNVGVVRLTTSGGNIGADGVYDGNDDEVAEVPAIRPDAFGQVFIDMTLIRGAFAYINALEVVVRLPGDWNQNLLLDSADGVAFLDCLSGDGQTPTDAGCLPVFDFELDADVDMRDLAEFERGF
jgi:lysophospholipase L1-like esterase